ncbi:Fc receptor-like protein 5 [Mustelus asterias]
MLTVAAFPDKPSVSVNRPDHVYLKNEQIDVACEAPPSYTGSSFYLYRGGQSRPIKTKAAESLELGVTFPITDPLNTGSVEFSCMYKKTLSQREIISEKSDSLRVTLVDQRTTPVISLDQWTGVYVVGEKVTITCTVPGNSPGRSFTFYKGKRMLDTRKHIAKDNIGKFTVTDRNQSGRYQCKYRDSVYARWLESPLSETATITVVDSPDKPSISVNHPDQAFVRGEVIEVTCEAPPSYAGSSFYLYRGRQKQPIKTETASSAKSRVRFTISNQLDKGSEFIFCLYMKVVSQREIISERSETVSVTVVDEFAAPVISLDQRTGVYVVGEKITIACTAPGNSPERIVTFYKGNRMLDTRHVVTKDNIGTLMVTNRNQAGQYQCKYGDTVYGQWLESPLSETVTVTVVDLPKPNLSVHIDPMHQGGEIRLNCTSPRDRPGVTFYLYRQGEVSYSDVQAAAAGGNSVNFTIKNVDQKGGGGNYTCRYEEDVSRRKVFSDLSDPVHIPIRDNVIGGRHCNVRVDEQTAM